MAITIKELLPSDNISQQAEKINFNFDQLLLAGGGPPGPTGPIGIQGVPGPQGQRGAYWYTGATLPNAYHPSPGITGATGALLGDFYLYDNLNAAGDGDVWEFDGLTWYFTGTNIKGNQGASGTDGAGGNFVTWRGFGSGTWIPSPGDTNIGSTAPNFMSLEGATKNKDTLILGSALDWTYKMYQNSPEPTRTPRLMIMQRTIDDLSTHAGIVIAKGGTYSGGAIGATQDFYNQASISWYTRIGVTGDILRMVAGQGINNANNLELSAKQGYIQISTEGDVYMYATGGYSKVIIGGKNYVGLTADNTLTGQLVLAQGTYGRYVMSSNAGMSDTGLVDGQIYIKSNGANSSIIRNTPYDIHWIPQNAGNTVIMRNASSNNPTTDILSIGQNSSGIFGGTNYNRYETIFSGWNQLATGARTFVGTHRRGLGTIKYLYGISVQGNTSRASALSNPNFLLDEKGIVTIIGNGYDLTAAIPTTSAWIDTGYSSLSNGSLDIKDGDFRYRKGAVSGFVLVTDGFGIASWKDPLSGFGGLWTYNSSTNSIHPNGNSWGVSIGDSAPITGYMLDVNGDANVRQSIRGASQRFNAIYNGDEPALPITTKPFKTSIGGISIMNNTANTWEKYPFEALTIHSPSGPLNVHASSTMNILRNATWGCTVTPPIGSPYFLNNWVGITNPMVNSASNIMMGDSKLAIQYGQPSLTVIPGSPGQRINFYDGLSMALYNNSEGGSLGDITIGKDTVASGTQLGKLFEGKFRIVSGTPIVNIDNTLQTESKINFRDNDDVDNMYYSIGYNLATDTFRIGTKNTNYLLTARSIIGNSAKLAINQNDTIIPLIGGNDGVNNGVMLSINIDSTTNTAAAEFKGTINSSTVTIRPTTTTKYPVFSIAGALGTPQIPLIYANRSGCGYILSHYQSTINANDRYVLKIAGDGSANAIPLYVTGDKSVQYNATVNSGIMYVASSVNTNRLAFDAYTIQAQTSAGPGVLYLQRWGGGLRIGASMTTNFVQIIGSASGSAFMTTITNEDTTNGQGLYVKTSNSDATKCALQIDTSSTTPAFRVFNDGKVDIRDRLIVGASSVSGIPGDYATIIKNKSATGKGLHVHQYNTSGLAEAFMVQTNSGASIRNRIIVYGDGNTHINAGIHAHESQGYTYIGTQGSYAVAGDGVTIISEHSKVYVKFNNSFYSLSRSIGYYTTGGVGALSDVRLKTNIKGYTGSLGIITKLNPVTYNWNDLYIKNYIELNSPTLVHKDDNKEVEAYHAKIKELRKNCDKTEIGLIAQEVEQIAPELVKGTEGDRERSINYDKITLLLINAIKEQQIQIEELKEKINKLETA